MMAGDWIKMRGNLWDDPRVGRICDLTGCTEAAAIGGLYWLWTTADQHTEDGLMTGLSLRQIDRKTGIEGFGAALVAIDWLSDDQQGVSLKRFDEHNGESAKRRCTTAQRVAKHRANAEVTQVTLQAAYKSVELPLAREREREDIKQREPTVLVDCSAVDQGSATYKVPDCPYDAIVRAYTEALPALPQVSVLNGARRSHMKARWREVCATDKLASDTGLDFFRWYFARVAQSPFLSGRGRPNRDGRVWKAVFDWLLLPTNFAKVVEGRYHGKVAA